MTPARPLLLIGAGGLGRETAEVVRAINAVRPTFEVIGFLDDDRRLTGTDRDGTPVVGTIDDLDRFAGAHVVLTTAGTHDLRSRHRIATRLSLPADAYESIVHPAAVLANGTELGAGCIVLASAVTTSSIHVGRHVVVMPAAVFSHDDVIEDFVTVGAGVHIGGGVTIREGAYVGLGALVREHITIGRWSIVAMGAVVLKDVPDGEIHAGVPAKCIGVVDDNGFDG